MASWITYSPNNGCGEGQITLSTGTYSDSTDRETTLIAYNEEKGITASTEVVQFSGIITGIAFQNLTWVTDIPASGGIATKDNCSYTIIGYFDDGTTRDITRFATVTGSLPVLSTKNRSRSNVGVLTLTAEFLDVITSATVDVYQAAYTDEYGSLEVVNLKWNEDVPYTGGVATVVNCVYTVYLVKNNGVKENVTEKATVTGSLSVPHSTVVNRHAVGNLFLTFNYSGFSVTESVIAYQKANITDEEYFYAIIVNIPQAAASRDDAYISINNISVEYNRNNTGWVAENVVRDLKTGDIIKFRGNIQDNTNVSFYTYDNGVDYINGFIIHIGGNPNSLFNSKRYAGRFFVESSYVQDASDLQLTTTDLTTIPFQGGDHYVSDGCYSRMFTNCPNLYYAPKLPARKLTIGCYSRMFQSCRNLIDAPELPAMNLAIRCYEEMFSNCSRLSKVPTVLAAGTLYKYCYFGMFENTSINTAPEIRANTIDYGCCLSMFEDCTRLESAPLINPKNVYLPYTTGESGNNAYSNMFQGCTNLSYIKCLATGETVTDVEEDFIFEWVRGVQTDSGLFIKSPNANWNRATTNNNWRGIPQGWTIIDADIS